MGMRTTTLQYAWNNFGPGLRPMITHRGNAVPEAFLTEAADLTGKS